MADIKSNATLTTGLSWYLDMNEESGGTAAVTRYDLHGTKTFADNNTVASSTTAKLGNRSADFVAANTEYLSIASDTDYQYSGTQTRSFSVWVNPDTTTGLGVILSKWGSNQEYLLYRNGTSVVLGIRGSGAAITASSALSTGVWTHVMFTLNASNTGELFINNVSAGTGTGGAQSAGTDEVRIGTQNNGNNDFDGKMQNAGWWTKVLTSTERSDLYNSGSGIVYWDAADIVNDTELSASLVSHYKLDEAAGTNKDDSNTTNGNDLSDPSSVASTTGIIDNAANFDGATDYLNITDASQTGLDLSGDCSFSFWINRTTSTGDRWILCKSRFDGSLQSYDIWQNGGTIHGRFSDDGTNTASHKIDFNTSSSVLSTSTTHHVLITFDISTETVTVYVDGVNQAVSKSGTMGASLYNNAMDFVIGRRNRTSPGQYLHGWLDEVIVYSKEATVGEARALYGYGTPPEYGSVAAASSIKSMYGITQANMKSVHGITNANIKSIHGIANS